MNKILIISSENLYEGYTLGSTFELSQGKILLKKFNVSIISVSKPISLFSVFKSILKTLITLNKNSHLRSLLILFLEIFSHIVFNKKNVIKYKIEGIDVYESKNYSIVSFGNFITQLKRWVNSGDQAYTAYYHDNKAPDIIHAHGRFLNAGALALSLKKKYGIKYVYTEHSTYYQNKIAPIEAKSVLEEVILHSDTFIAVSESLKNEVEKYLKRKFKEAIIIPNVIDPIFETDLPLQERDDGLTKFIIIASLDYKKGIDILLRSFAFAFNRNRLFCLSIIGCGPLKDDLQTLADELGLDEVVSFLGIRSKEEILSLLDNSDIFVLSSRIETFGVVVIEALSRGLPVIVTRSGGPEFIVRENCGLVVDVDNLIEMENAMKNMAKSFQSYNKDAIRKYTIDTYGTKAFLRRMENIYNSCVQ